MKPVTLCKKTIGVRCWLHRRMKLVPFKASSPLMIGIWFCNDADTHALNIRPGGEQVGVRKAV